MDEQQIAGIRAAAQQWADNYALLTGKQVIALLDALTAREAEVARLREAVFSVEWMENEICTSDSTRYICPFCLHYSASNAHNPAGHYPDCVIALAEPPPGDGIQLRPEVQTFAEAMQRLLDKHQDEKGDAWKTDEVDGLVDALDRAIERLRVVTTFAQVGGELRAELWKATASVGLHAMFVADVMDALAAPPVEDKESPHRVNDGEGAGI